ncbi:dihydrofolate reductase family protein [Chitinophaga rhizophila]|uniref:Dihydrofolate reductase family protein n=1 Tax=Chitinophaga rhizophila TaxID=2866212 RepID=A0ABS7GIV7_9BACT|nr:dihydrofolate reductase family protein [Chitinophaga rhizophila]MBW8687241.1 dihydrofolate reductase family protein [Chitinophaga rhizophila]
MRTVTFCMNISLDGYCDHTIGSPSEELMDYFTAMMEDVDLLFYGRVMYQLMFPYWENVRTERSGSPAENRFADRLCAIDRVVVSATMDTEDPKTRVVRGGAAEELLKLKRQPGRNISVDSVSMLPVLINADLIDEFYLVIHPVMAGRGRQLLPSGSLTEMLRLKLTDTSIFKNGCVAHHYVKQ